MTEYKLVVVGGMFYFAMFEFVFYLYRVQVKYQTMYSFSALLLRRLSF